MDQANVLEVEFHSLVYLFEEELEGKYDDGATDVRTEVTLEVTVAKSQFAELVNQYFHFSEKVDSG